MGNKWNLFRSETTAKTAWLMETENCGEDSLAPKDNKALHYYSGILKADI